MTDITVKTVPSDKARAEIVDIPNVSYSKEFERFTQKRHGLQTVFLEINLSGRRYCLLPVNFGKGEGFSVCKDYTEPFFFPESGTEIINWNLAARAIKKQLNLASFEMTFAFLGSEERIGCLRKKTVSTFALNLKNNETGDSIMARLDKKTRNQVRQALKADLETTIVGERDINDIYPLYETNMRRHGTPPRNKRFFSDLFECFGEKALGIGARKNGKLVGLNFFQMHGSCLRLMFNLSQEEFWNLRVNDFLYYKMIEFAAERNIQTVDFGPSSSADHTHNRFKLNFGAEEVPIYGLQSESAIGKMRKWVRHKKFNLQLRYDRFKS